MIDTSTVKENGFLEQEQETYSKKTEGHTAYNRGADGCRGGEERCIRGCTLKQ